MALASAVAAVTGAFLARRVQQSATYVSYLNVHPAVVYKLLRTPQDYLALTGRSYTNFETVEQSANGDKYSFDESFRGLVLTKTVLSATSTTDKVNNDYSFRYSFKKMGADVVEEVRVREFENGTEVEYKTSYEGRALPVYLMRTVTDLDHFFGSIEDKAEAVFSDVENTRFFNDLFAMQRRVRDIDAARPKTLELPSFPAVQMKHDLDEIQVDAILSDPEVATQFKELTASPAH